MGSIPTPSIPVRRSSGAARIVEGCTPPALMARVRHGRRVWEPLLPAGRFSGMIPCPACRKPTSPSDLADAGNFLDWTAPEGACPACVQERLLRLLLSRGDAALHRAVQAVWPIDPEAAFGALPTPLRLHADPRFTGQGVAIAIVDSGFHPHPDLVQASNRIRCWIDLGRDDTRTLRWGPTETPRWPGWDRAADHQWHGTMTAVVAAGNGYLSRGLYRGLASQADLALVAVRDHNGRITNETVARALLWVLDHREEFGIRVVSLSVSGDPIEPGAPNPVDPLVSRLTAAGVTVVAAAGNDGTRRLVPPASAPDALTVGGIDDQGLLDHGALRPWHSNFGSSTVGGWKPEVVAPSLWVAAPVLPGTIVAEELTALFARRRAGDRTVDERLAELKAITPHYQHVEGTSFAAPVAAAAVACLLQANPRLTPGGIREILLSTAQLVGGVDRERQGAGVLDPGRAVARALAEEHPTGPGGPVRNGRGVEFRLHDHHALQVEIFGSWDGWAAPVMGFKADGLWRTQPLDLGDGAYAYKFRLDGSRWIDDPANPVKQHDGLGGLNSLLQVPQSQG